jgi:hypothetical protein
MRDEMLSAVVRRAMEHPEFRDRLMADPQKALDDHGFALEPEEMREIETISRDLQSSAAGDVETKLNSVAEKYGLNLSRN